MGRGSNSAQLSAALKSAGPFQRADITLARAASQRFRLMLPPDPPEMGSEAQRRREEQSLRALLGRPVTLRMRSHEKGTAYTDMRQLVVVPYNAPPDGPPEVQYITMRGAKYHEAAHLMYTDPAAFEQFTRKIADVRRTTGAVTGRQMFDLFNILEDGRIEERLRTFEPGIFKWVSAANLTDNRLPEVTTSRPTPVPRGMRWAGGVWPDGVPLSGTFDMATGNLTLDPNGPPAPQIVPLRAGQRPVDADGRPLPIAHSRNGPVAVIYPGTRLPLWTREPIDLRFQAFAAVQAAALPEHRPGELHPEVQAALDAVADDIDAAVRGNTSDAIVRAMRIYDELASRGLVDPEPSRDAKDAAQQAMRDALRDAMTGSTAAPQMPSVMNLLDSMDAADQDAMASADMQQAMQDAINDASESMPQPTQGSGADGNDSGAGAGANVVDDLFGGEAGSDQQADDGSAGSGAGDESSTGDSGSGGDSSAAQGGSAEPDAGGAGTDRDTGAQGSGGEPADESASDAGGGDSPAADSGAGGDAGGQRADDGTPDSGGGFDVRDQAAGRGSSDSSGGSDRADGDKTDDRAGGGDSAGSDGDTQADDTASGDGGASRGDTGEPSGRAGAGSEDGEPDGALPRGQREKNDAEGRGQVTQDELDDLIAEARRNIDADRAAQRRADTSAERAGRVGADRLNAPGVNIVSQGEMTRLGQQARSEGRLPDEKLDNIAGQMAALLQQIRGEARAAQTRRRSGRLDSRRFAAALGGDPKVFKRPGRAINTNAHIIDVIDVSGSVSARQREEQYLASKATAIAAQRAGLQYSAIAYTSGYGGVALYTLKDHHSRDISGLDGVLNCGGGSTPTAEGIELARAIARLARNPRTVINVQTDGGADDPDACREQVEAARHEGIVVVGQFYGTEGDVAAMDHQFGRNGWNAIADLKDLPRLKMGLILDMIRASAGLRGRR